VRRKCAPVRASALLSHRAIFSRHGDCRALIRARRGAAWRGGLEHTWFVTSCRCAGLMVYSRGFLRTIPTRSRSRARWVSGYAMMFERYCHLFNRRARGRPDWIALRRSNHCRMIVVNAARRFAPLQERNQKSVQNRRVSWWRCGDSNPRPLTCEVIPRQKALPRKRPAKGAKPHSHRGLPAFRISRSFREFPRFSARMVVKWSSGARSAQARVLVCLDMLRADPDPGIR
jgi:hypothetical protein